MLAYLGSEGMGYFNSAYEIYALFCVVSTAGLPVALSVLISGAIARGEEHTVKRIYNAAVYIFLSIGILGSGIMLFFARWFCRFIQSENAYFSILAIAPTVLFICISSALRGYFQGYKKMLPTALSQLIEALGKLIFGLLFARYALNREYETPIVAAYAGLGLTLGTLLSVIYLIIEKNRFHRMSQSRPSCFQPRYKTIWRSTLRLAVPMTLGASLVSLTKLIDMTMILRRLQAIGYTETLANRAYGSYTTLALSVFGLLPTLLNSVALPLVPSLSGAIAAKDVLKQRQMIRMSYRLTAIFAIPAAVGISAFATPVLNLLFSHDAEAVAIAGPLLAYLGVSVFLSCMITATNSVLHAYQVVNRPILALMIGAVVKVISAYFLIGNTNIGLLGAPISTFLCNLSVVLLNLYFASKLCEIPDLLSLLLRPMIASGISVGLGYVGYRYLSVQLGASAQLTVATIAVIGLLYFILACLTKTIQAEDILAMPMGGIIFKFLTRIHLVKTSELERTIDKANGKERASFEKRQI